MSKTSTTKLAEKKQLSYLRLESASNWQLIRSLWKRVNVYILALAVGLILGTVI